MTKQDKQDFTDFLKLAKEFLVLTTEQLDPYTSTKGQIIVGDRQITLLTPAHIQFAKYGRGPGKKPPFEVIEAWIKKENIRFEGLSEKGTAFLIQTSIGNKGTSNYVKNAPNALEEALNNNIQEYNKKLNSALLVKINGQVLKILNDVPKNNSFKI